MINSDDEALYQFSSGSTVKPKLAGRTHYNILSEAENVCKTIGISRKDKLLCAVPLFHAYGFGTVMTPSIYAGATLILINKFNPRRVLNMLKNERITMFFGVPYMFSLLFDIAADKKIELLNLKYCFSAGISLPPEVSRNFYRKFGVFVRDLYGTTETGCISVNLNKDVGGTLDSVGLPIKGTKVNIKGEDEKKARIGENGEIIVKTPTCGRWYYIENAKKPIAKNGYLYTGDIGKKDRKGNLYIVGRKTSFINVAGAKVDPVEVEEVIRKYPGIKDVAVLGYQDKLRGEVVKAVIVSNGAALDKKSILKYCRNKIADFKVPRIIEARDKLPRSPLGKLLKGYL
jgi:long-chain acyl-CoA synthetase